MTEARISLVNDIMLLDPSNVRDLRPLALNPAGRLRILPSAFWEETTVQERALFGHRTGTYLFPTVELVDHLRTLIGGRTAIEIGAGNGVLAHALGIKATDSRMHEKPPWRHVYGTGPGKMGPPVTYGPNIIEADAAAAVRRYRPQVVIAGWVTHLADPRYQSSPGSPAGVDENDVLDRCEHYIFIGDEYVHRGKPIWAKPHTTTSPPFIFSRATNGARPILTIWPGRRPPRQTP